MSVLVEAQADMAESMERLEADELTAQMAQIIDQTIDNPAIPMFVRVAGMAMLIGGAGQGALEMLLEGATVTQFHRHDLLPNIAKGLRAAAVIYEALADQAAAPAEGAKLDG